MKRFLKKAGELIQANIASSQAVIIKLLNTLKKRFSTISVPTKEADIGGRDPYNKLNRTIGIRVRLKLNGSR